MKALKNATLNLQCYLNRIIYGWIVWSRFIISNDFLCNSLGPSKLSTLENWVNLKDWLKNSYQQNDFKE